MEILDQPSWDKDRIESPTAKNIRLLETILLVYGVAGALFSFFAYISLFKFLNPFAILPFLFFYRGFIASIGYRLTVAKKQFVWCLFLSAVGAGLRGFGALLMIQSWLGGRMLYTIGVGCIFISVVGLLLTLLFQKPPLKERQIIWGIVIRTTVFLIMTTSGILSMYYHYSLQ